MCNYKMQKIWGAAILLDEKKKKKNIFTQMIDSKLHLKAIRSLRIGAHHDSSIIYKNM